MILPLLLFCRSVAGAAPEAESAWNEILAQQEQEQKLIHTLRFQYRVEVREGVEINPSRVAVYQSEYIKSEDKSSFNGTVTNTVIGKELENMPVGGSDIHLSPSKAPSKVNFTTDGTFVYLKRAGSIARTRNLSYARPSIPLPLDLVQLYSTARIIELTNAGQFAILNVASTDLNGHHTRKVSFGYAENRGTVTYFRSQSLEDPGRSL